MLHHTTKLTSLKINRNLSTCTCIGKYAGFFCYIQIRSLLKTKQQSSRLLTISVCSGTMRKVKFLLAWLLALALPYAATNILQAQPHRCNGMVQQRPCNQLLPARKLRRVVNRTILRRREPSFRNVDPSAYAQVIQKSYRPVGQSEGLWKGVIAGNGTVHLKLNILRGGEVESSRYMGRVYLQNRSTWFSFKTMAPKGGGWSWNIEAFNS